MILSVAINVGRIIRSVAASIKEINSTYNAIVKGLHDRKLLRLDARRKDLEFNEYELAHIEREAERTARLLGFDSVSEINERTGHPYRTLKILLSFYRRIRILARYQNSNKANFPDD